MRSGAAAVLARAAQVEAKAGAHVVHREERAVLMAEGGRPAKRPGAGAAPVWWSKRRRHHHRDLARMRGEARPQFVRSFHANSSSSSR